MSPATPKPEVRRHSLWGASNSHRWMACPGSVNLCREIPSVDSVYAAEGRAAHTLGETCLATDSDPFKWIGTKIDEFEVTEEMAEAVRVYVQCVRTDQIDFPSKRLIEHGFNLSSVHEGLFGTNDCALVGETRLIIYDYKHGKGVPVEVSKVVDGVVRYNSQMMYYALGALLELPAAKRAKIEEVEIVIVQPRCPHRDGPVRRVTIPALELVDWTFDLVAAVKRTLAEDAPLIPGDHCRFCPAAARCPALHQQAVEVAQSDFAGKISLPTVKMLTHDQIGQILQRADLVESWFADMRSYAEAALARGETIPGCKLIPKRPYRKYVVPEADVIQWLQAEHKFDLDDIAPRKLATVAQVEAMIPKKQREGFSSLWKKESSGNRLALESDPTPPVLAPAVTDFANLIQHDGG